MVCLLLFPLHYKVSLRFGILVCLKSAHRFQLSQITVVIGEPIYFTEQEISNTSRETYQLLSNRVMEAIGALKLP